MEFRNLTPFPSMAFDALDQLDQRFHTVVMRLTFEQQANGTLALAPVQTPLVMTDEYYGEINSSSVKQESDLAPYKPHTDVIVIANACAPQGKASAIFPVALKIMSPPVPLDLPPKPYGLNPGMQASPDRFAEWQRECARLEADATQDSVLLHKVLMVKGAREWRKRNALARVLSIFTLSTWKLTKPQPIAKLPLRYEYSFGGENKVLVTDRAARRVRRKYRLPGRLPQPASAGVNSQNLAIAHSVYEYNPVGRGFAERWYQRATRLNSIPAPQIEAFGEPVRRFDAAYAPEGFGVVGRSWRPRLQLAGTYDQNWVEKRHPNLPADFDFAYWNAAPSDQQVAPHLTGDETIMLMNLCPAGSTTVQDSKGNTCLSLALPGHLPFVLVRFEDGRIGELAAKLDTLIIDAVSDEVNPQKRLQVVCVWRATVATEPGVRVLEARMLAHADVVALREQADRASTFSPESVPIGANPRVSPTI